MTSLEGWSSTIELHPRGPAAQAEQASCVGYRLAPVPARQAQVTAKQNPNDQPERSRVSPGLASPLPLREPGRPAAERLVVGRGMASRLIPPEGITTSRSHGVAMIMKD
jgi:hypothetical protein